MTTWAVSMGAHRFAITAATQPDAQAELDLRCERVGIDRTDAFFFEQTVSPDTRAAVNERKVATYEKALQRIADAHSGIWGRIAYDALTPGAQTEGSNAA